jgi:pyruvate/2-oxoglutarate dehydrogenase complex dihydrolipoamide dehydrogenase (E3) component
MAATQRYDAIVVGSGQGGNPLAKALAAAGRKVAVIEREHVGGTCINVGCTPTKTMVASARVAYLARRAADFGVRTGSVSVDQATVRERKRNIVNRWRSGSERGLSKAPGLDLLMGEASFSGPKTLEVQLNSGEHRTLTADLVFVNSGARPARPQIPGLDRVPSLDSTSVMELGEVPDHLMVIGGGYIGLEFGQMFRRFGSRVTIIQRGTQLLVQEDPDVSQAVLDVLVEDGVEVVLQRGVRSVAPAPGGEIAVAVGDGDGPAPRVITGSHLLVAAGRVPNTERLNLDAAGVETDQKGYIRVNDRLETSAPGVFALGDVKPGPAFTHISYDDFRIIETNLIKGGHATTKDRLVPYAVFIDPELGRVGLSEGEARRQGRKIRVAKMPMSHVARATEADEKRGLMKVVTDASTDQILGCAILGISGGELMSMVEIAMMGHLPYTALQNAIFAHPTLAESLNNLFDYIEPAGL